MLFAKKGLRGIKIFGFRNEYKSAYFFIFVVGTRVWLFTIYYIFRFYYSMLITHWNRILFHPLKGELIIKQSLLGSHHDYRNQSEGLLFIGNPEKFEAIFEWCKRNKGSELYWIAELLPLFDKQRNKESKWHGYAKKFIDEFGNDKNVLSAIGAKLGTYSWTGSVVPKLESDKALFVELLDHPFPSVREWAQLHIEDLDKRIKWESNRDEEDIIWKLLL